MLPAALFVDANIALMHQVVAAQIGRGPAGHPRDKTGPWSPAAAKPYRQKGTSARQELDPRSRSSRAVAQCTDRSRVTTQPADPEEDDRRRAAGALSDRARNQRIHALTEVVSGQTRRPESAKSFLGTLTDRRRVLVVIGRPTRWAPERAPICLACM